MPPPGGWRIQNKAGFGFASAGLTITHAALWRTTHPYRASGSAFPAEGIYPVGSGQGFGTTQGFATGGPEPAEWGMMLVGFGGMGAAMRSRRRRQAAA
jgi:hypothetical protein